MSSFLWSFVNNGTNLLAISSLWLKWRGFQIKKIVLQNLRFVLHRSFVSSDTQPPDEASSPVYGNVDSQPPVPPRQGRSIPLPSKQYDGPPLPPRTRQDNVQPSRRKKASNGGERRAYFSKIFNGCPLHLNCAAAWVHPITNCELKPSTCRLSSGARPLFVACA